jgi:hypothetical protein
VTLFADVLLIAGGVFVGRWIARSVGARRRGAVGEEGQQEEAPAPSRDPLRGFPCKLGDVILRTAEHDEAWLAGALIFEEDAPVAALFVAPEAGGDRALFVRAAAGSGIVWLAPLPSGAIAKTSEPPHALELEGTRFERIRRLPVHVSRVGSGAPDVGTKAIILEYAGAASERVVVVAGSERQASWRGALLSDGEYEVLPGERPVG